MKKAFTIWAMVVVSFAVRGTNLSGSVPIGPSTLPDWKPDAQVKLGWIFDDPKSPVDLDIRYGWDRYVGGEETPPDWIYDADRVDPWGGNPAQWYIKIPNLINDNPYKNFWLSFIYERDNTYQGSRVFTNLDWYPSETLETVTVFEDMFDSSGDPTDNVFLAAYGRMTIAYTLFPNPQYEEIWIGVTGSPANSFDLVEAYVITQCVSAPCIVDMDDLLFFVDDWLKTEPGLVADFVGDDGIVDLLDFTYLAEYWMSNCPSGWPW